MIAASLSALAFAATAPEADLILKNGRIWTGDPQNPWAEAIAIRRNRIIAVGNNTDVADRAASDARVIDLAGRLTVPGFNDAHVHFTNGALRLVWADLAGACAIDEVQRRIRDYGAAHPHDAWIVGIGWDPSCLPDHRLPGRADIDAAVKDRGVFISSVDGRTAWVNSKALQLAGILKGSRFDAAAGKVVLEPSGEPSGILRESAQALVRRLIPPPSHEHRLAALEQAVKMAAAFGITSIQNAGGDEDTLQQFEDLDHEHKLTLRVDVALSVPPTATPEFVDHLLELKQLYREPRLHVNGAEFVMDGTVAAHTAAMLEPYADEPGVFGKTNWSQDAWEQVLALCDSGGLQLWTHAAGDRAVRMALDGYEYVRRVNEPRDPRFRIEHAEVMAAADIPRFARIGVLASESPIHADPALLDDWSKAVGPQRLGMAFPWHSLDQAGARLVFSSDWPTAVSMDPLLGIHCAVNRQTPDGKPPGGWVPSQRVSVETALRAYTTNGAFASFEDRLKGRLRRGMFADLVVLSQNLFEIDPRHIARTKVDMTIFDGQVIYTRQ